VRSRLAIFTTRAVNGTSRRLGRGQGTVAGGRSGLKVDPQLLQHLTSKREVSLVSGTNGKTTTTRLLAVALGADGSRVVSNETGSNMPPGHVAALAADRSAPRAVLEVDEIYLPRVLAATKPAAVVLLNLSRDQLDRTNEVRMVAGNWRAALAAAPHATVVANADDPLVVWAAGAAARVQWVAAGLSWQLDAVGCPSCEGRIAFDADGAWACVMDCGFVRPEPMASLTTEEHGTVYRGVWADGRDLPIRLVLPGRFNHANALMAAVAAESLGIDAAAGLAAMSGIAEVAGRFTTRLVAGVRTRLMLAKNPAGWSELLDLVANDDGPIVISINARTADGADPSWLWDVPFERLAPRVVVATGDRCRDLSVRLQYAGVAHVTVEDPTEAVRTAHADSHGHIERVDVIGNYTAFAELLAAGTPEPIETGLVEAADLHAAGAHVADGHGAEATGDRSGGS
jgi:UDP-N-acetylmuramyl tripeptide synthase